MKYIKKALIDTIILGGILLIIAVFQKPSETIYRALIPIVTIVCYNFFKAAFRIYRDTKTSSMK